MEFNATQKQIAIVDSWQENRDKSDLYVNSQGERFVKIDKKGVLSGIHRWIVTHVLGYSKCSDDLKALCTKVSNLVTDDFIKKVPQKEREKIEGMGRFFLQGGATREERETWELFAKRVERVSKSARIEDAKHIAAQILKTKQIAVPYETLVPAVTSRILNEAPKSEARVATIIDEEIAKMRKK